MTDAKDNISRQIFGDGTGKLATCAVNTTTVTLTVSSVQFLMEGMLVDICQSNGTVTQAEREILVVDDVANTIKISGANITTAATDIVVVSGSYGLEMTGMSSVFTVDSTLYGIDRSQNKWFNPIVKAVGGEISEVQMQWAEDEADRKAGSKINFWISSYGVRRAYQNLLLATKQIVQPMKLEGGWNVLSYNGQPFTTDKYAPDSTLTGLDLSTWRLYQMQDFDWINNQASVA